MFLCIAFHGESIPFIMNDSDDACLNAIEAAKKEYRFNRLTAIVESDHIYLEAFPLKPKPKKRLYIRNNKVILETDSQFPDEVIATKELLAYDLHCDVNEIQSVDV